MKCLQFRCHTPTSWPVMNVDLTYYISDLTYLLYLADLKSCIKCCSVTTLQTLWNSLTIRGTPAHVKWYSCHASTNWMLLITRTDANMQLTINTFWPLFPDNIFPWHCQIPDIYRFSRHTVTLMLTTAVPPVENNTHRSSASSIFMTCWPHTAQKLSLQNCYYTTCIKWLLRASFMRQLWWCCCRNEWQRSSVRLLLSCTSHINTLSYFTSNVNITTVSKLRLAHIQVYLGVGMLQ